MRRTNDAFKAEVFRRSREFKAKRARQRKQLLAVTCCLVLAAGAFLFAPSATEKLAADSANMTSAALAPESPAEAAWPEANGYGGSGRPDMESAEEGAPAARPIAPYLGSDVSAVTVIHQAGGSQSHWVIDGEALELLKEWANGLLYEPAEFPEGQTPGDTEGGEAYEFIPGGGAYPGFTYIINGSDAHWLLIEGYWYTVTNPSLPPLSAPGQ